MGSFLNKFLKTVIIFFYLISDKIFPKVSFRQVKPSAQSIRVKSWFNDNGDKTHRVNYDLKEDSIVMDVGGYEGQWASDIFSKYVCTIHIFEPFKEFAQKIKERFKRNSKITVHNYGLAKATGLEKLNISADSSSTYKTGDVSVETQMVKIDDFLNENNFTHIDLIKINIEGGEYDLLEFIIENGLIKIFENIQVQFHDFVPNATYRMKAIQKNLSKTHSLTYQYQFVWENWKLVV